MINRTFARQTALCNADMAFDQFQDYGMPGMTDAERLEYAINSGMLNAFHTIQENDTLHVSETRFRQCADEMERAYRKRVAELRAAL
jgi:hypothetical protein